MSDLIGVRHDDRHACTDDRHLPNCWNPNISLTACVCGDVWWRGHVGVWVSRQLREPDQWVKGSNRPRPGAVTGWDRYFLHTAGCPDDARCPGAGHVCGDAVGMSYVEASA